MIVPSRRGFLKASTGVVTSAGIASLAWAEKAPAGERARVGMAHFLIHSFIHSFIHSWGGLA